MGQLQFWGGTIRKMWPSETQKFRDHLLRLDRESRRLRFGMPVDDTFITDYASRAAAPGTIVYGYFVGGEMHGAAEMRLLGEDSPGDAEGAFSVEAEYQNRGIGTELLGRIVRAARNRGISRLYMNCLAENRKMQRLARKFEAQLHFDHGEVVGRVLPPVPTYLSLWDEAMDDGRGFVMAVMDFPLRPYGQAH
jgi:RimJ/RimL family protein N-acetyltransferase